MPKTAMATVAAILLAGTGAAVQAQEFPKPDWADRPDPVASPYATVGGEVVVFAGQSPKSFNYYLDNNVFSAQVFGAMYESLLTMNPMTLEYDPHLARTWSIAADKLTFTFRLDPAARWSDGRPITTADVAWTYNTIVDPANMTGPHKISLERLHPPVVHDDQTISFTAKEVHWQNLGAAGGFEILPRHAFAARDFNRINFEFPVISGPYRLGEIKEGIYVTLERRRDWWKREMPSSRNTGNFQTVKYKFFAERENAFEAFKQGLIDVFAVYTARLWVNETTDEQFVKNWIVKQKIHNHHPIGFQGFAMNMRRPLFADVRVRAALAHLIDRPRMNRTLMYDQYFLLRSYYPDLYDEHHPCPNELVAFDQEKARKLLHEAGWRVDPQTGFLRQNGRRLSFKFLTRSPSSDKFLAIYAEDLKDVGIELVIDKKDWAAWAKDMDEYNYDMTWAAWGAGLFKDPESMWHSREVNRKSGNNITGFHDARVDALIERQKKIFDVQERHALVREIDRLVFAQHPYALLWNIDYVRLLYWNKFGTPDTVLSKYGTESVNYWWLDHDAEAELEHAKQSGQALPRKPAVVRFDEVFAATPGAAATDAEPTGAAATAAPRPQPPTAETAPAAAEESTPSATRLVALLFGLTAIVLIALVLRRLVPRRNA